MGDPRVEYATPKSSLAGDKAGAGWYSEAHPAANHTSNTGTAAEDVEPGLVQPRPHNAVGCMLRGVLRVPKVRVDDHLRGR